MAQSEAVVIWDTFQKVRDLTKWYFSLLKGADARQQLEINGEKLNSALWLASHLAWAENFLAIQGTGGEGVDIPWLDHYKIASDGTIHSEQHDMRAALDALKAVHEKATAHVSGLTDEKLEAPNMMGFGFGGISTSRILIQHLIRHEAMHTGHLSWLCKMNKIKRV
jgi:uncharacterized damage-inducible protein DinB